MKQFLYPLVIFCFFITACKEYPCEPATAEINFKGFLKSDLDTIVVSKFQRSSNFGTVLQVTYLDSLSLLNWNGNILQANPFFGNEFGLHSNYDYEVYLPKINRRIRITEITEEYQTRKAGLSMDKVGCYDPIKSYKVDGQLLTNTPQETYSINILK